jgi:hypothetical protein
MKSHLLLTAPFPKEVTVLKAFLSPFIFPTWEIWPFLKGSLKGVKTVYFVYFFSNWL